MRFLYYPDPGISGSGERSQYLPYLLAELEDIFDFSVTHEHK